MSQDSVKTWSTYICRFHLKSEDCEVSRFSYPLREFSKVRKLPYRHGANFRAGHARNRGYDLIITWSKSDAEIANGPARGALNSWVHLVRSVRSNASSNRLEEARSAVAAVLIPSGAAFPHHGGAADLAEQMTADVSAVSPEQRSAAMTELGAAALPFVQAVWVCDMSIRARSAFESLFGDGLLEDAMSDGPIEDGHAWIAQEEFLREVAKLSRVDPVTSEVVRLRGAHAHGCRLCRSLRSRRAVLAAGGEEFFEPLAGDLESIPELTYGQRTAVRVVDTFLWQPTAWSDDLTNDVRAAFSAHEAVELVLDIVRNAANKIAVAFGADAPHVADGVEYYDIDFTSGELQYGLPPA